MSQDLGRDVSDLEKFMQENFGLPNFIFEEMISVIITPPITPDIFWGFDKPNTQEKLHCLVLSLLRKITPSFTP